MALEKFIEDALARLADRNYVPREFIELRDQIGLVAAISQCVEGSGYKSNFLRVLELGMVEWSLEAAVIKHPDRFSILTVSHAHARLKGILGAPAGQSDGTDLTPFEFPMSHFEETRAPPPIALRIAVPTSRTGRMEGREGRAPGQGRADHKKQLRLRFQIMIGVASVSAVALCIITQLRPDWMEMISGWDLDQRNGLAEWMMTGTITVIAVGSYALAAARRA